MKKVPTGGNWKSQFGGADIQDMPLTPQFRSWVDACAELFGGMDLLALDGLCDTNGNMHIIEMNGSAMGITPSHWREDTEVIVDMAVQRL